MTPSAEGQMRPVPVDAAAEDDVVEVEATTVMFGFM